MDPAIIKKATGLAMDLLIKSTRADIRLHGKENIPSQPVVFVVNHFTRMETFFLPYMLIKKLGKEVLSLAHHSFFLGNFGAFMSALGAISTRDPERDRILLGALLRGDRSCMIFPEGQMIKDKKLVEKGKYLIYNSGIRRPPHTGAGILALRSELIRSRIRHLHTTGEQSELDSLMEYFSISGPDQLRSVMEQETFIVPVNITYFPVRARNNIINRIAHMFIHNLPERIEEELQVEGTMLLDGVDIDINFGEPLPMAPYMDSRSMKKKITGPGMSPAAMDPAGDRHLRTLRLALMYRYMERIYGMTTVNHDHIFATLLLKYNKRRISRNDFRNRAFLAIDEIRHVNMQSHHTNLKMKQTYLLTDDIHGRYDDFIEAAKSDGLIFEDRGFLYKNRERFSNPYEFHTIRRDNIIEVLHNEIEPLKEVVKSINRIMRTPECLIKRKIRNLVYRRDLEIFENDYRCFFKEDESKPEHIGRPFFLKRRLFNRRGVLLVHGYMAAPEEIRALANYLHERGFAVYGVRLRGHGTAPEDLAGRQWQEWYESVNRGYVVLKNTVRRMAVAGFSTGAGLALHQAVNKGDVFKGVISISAPLKLVNIGSKLASTLVLWNSLLERLHVRRGRMEFVTNEPENRHINYFRNPISGIHQLEKCMDDLEEKLKNLAVPTLIIQGSEDPVVNPASAGEIFEKAGTRDKEICRVYSTRHGIINGEGSQKVFRRVEVFLREVMP